jgi:hypothetical protein
MNLGNQNGWVGKGRVDVKWLGVVLQVGAAGGHTVLL